MDLASLLCIQVQNEIPASQQVKFRLTPRQYNALNHRGVLYHVIMAVDSKAALDDLFDMSGTKSVAFQANNNGAQKATGNALLHCCLQHTPQQALQSFVSSTHAL